MKSFLTLARRPPIGHLVLAAFVVTGLLFVMPGQASAQKTFKTPDAAAEALVEAARADDQREILAILGSSGNDIASSGDPVADAGTRKRFVAAYNAKHEVTIQDGSKGVLVIGEEDFPFPIPLVRKGSLWQFDSLSGRREILYRRVGRNELDAIQACLAYVDAQNEYAEKARTGDGAGIYAQRIISHPGTTDGLYWEASQRDGESPLGELIARASAEDYPVTGARTPFHGYYFKVLTQQGPAADGGALGYVVHGKMIGGFALVAYPATYRNSGVMTFIVNHNGVVYQQDLGRHTADLAERMTAFNPDGDWKKVTTLPPQ
jgi:hypothetical protein